MLPINCLFTVLSVHEDDVHCIPLSKQIGHALILRPFPKDVAVLSDSLGDFNLDHLNELHIVVKESNI